MKLPSIVKTQPGVWEPVGLSRPFAEVSAQKDIAFEVTQKIGIPTIGIGAGAEWKRRLCALADRYPCVPLSTMGFPADWRSRDFWS